MKSIVILISGRGSNMQALLEADLPDCRYTVISNRPDAAGLAYAQARGVTTAVVDHRDFASRVEFDAELARVIDEHAPDLVVLAGFMRILGADFTRHYAGRLMNIHPSLLPAFTGMHTHARALAAGCKIHGCSVHFVTAELDNGPIVVQAAVAVEPGDDEDSLASRVLAQEHRIYPQAVRWFLEGRLHVTQAGSVDLRGAVESSAILVAPRLA